MTQQTETPAQTTPPPERVTPSFTVIVEKTEDISRESKSKSITGTLGNGKPTHAFRIMANQTFPGSLKYAKGPSLSDTGIVMLTVHQLKDDGAPGKMVLAWEKSAAAPTHDTPETAELKTAMIEDIFAKFGYKKPVEQTPPPEEKSQVAEEIDHPAAKL
ncbi:MAG: hypothetical protein DYH13_04780 [Alphaproteobacteria bacterium PRO2]|nr:hypothetical protein [Alphaproteobacteria bacterium PRO2]